MQVKGKPRKEIIHMMEKKGKKKGGIWPTGPLHLLSHKPHLNQEHLLAVRTQAPFKYLKHTKEFFGLVM